MIKPLVYIIVVNWNLKEVTLECLDSLHQLKYGNFRIVVVDNHSEDDSIKVINERFPGVEQIYHNKNRGSTAGYNSGFQHALRAKADFVMLINNDTVIEPDALDYLVEACQKTGVGMVSPLIFYADAPDKIWSAGAMLNRLTMNLRENRKHIPKETVRRDFLTSCALVVKQEVLERVGLMDEDFFVYAEERDYCYRVRKAGYQLLLVPQAKVWHKVSLSSGGGDSPNERYWMAKNILLFYKKHAAWWQWFFILPVRAASAIKITMRLIATRKWKSLRSFWSGLLEGLSG